MTDEASVPDEESGRDDVTTSVELSLQELIYAGLEALRAARPGIDLVAYLHSSGDNGPQLFLAAPTMESLKPNEAFDLFTALRDALDRGVSEAPEKLDHLGGFAALAVVTTGAWSRGLHAVGRRDGEMAADDHAVLGPLAETLGNVVHRLEEVSRRVAT